MKNFLLLGFLIFITSACTPAIAPTPENQGNFTSIASQKENKVIYLRRSAKYVGSQYHTLHTYLKVLKHFDRRDQNGLYEVVAVFNNNRYENAGENLNCDVQFVFLDSDGLELEKTNWQPYMFPGGQDVLIKQIAMNPLAQDYKIYVREPRDAKW